MLDAMHGYDMSFGTDIKVVSKSVQCPPGYEHLFERVWPGTTEAYMCKRDRKVRPASKLYNEHSRLLSAN